MNMVDTQALKPLTGPEFYDRLNAVSNAATRIQDMLNVLPVFMIAEDDYASGIKALEAIAVTEGIIGDIHDKYVD